MLLLFIKMPKELKSASCNANLEKKTQYISYASNVHLRKCTIKCKFTSPEDFDS